jgi:hypothetical protein
MPRASSAGPGPPSFSVHSDGHVVALLPGTPDITTAVAIPGGIPLAKPTIDAIDGVWVPVALTLNDGMRLRESGLRAAASEPAGIEAINNTAAARAGRSGCRRSWRDRRVRYSSRGCGRTRWDLCGCPGRWRSCRRSRCCRGGWRRSRSLRCHEPGFLGGIEIRLGCHSHEDRGLAGKEVGTGLAQAVILGVLIVC